MSVRLIFSFDSEDYETPAADDAEKWWAETMTKHGITACVCVVGELARALRDRGRKDVIDAMAQHEIAFHSDMHSAHPTWAEYLETLNWEEGVERVIREESKGIADVREVFGQHPSAWCKPGASWGPHVAHAMVQMDVPFFCDSPFESGLGYPLWYDNCLFLSYHTSFDRYFRVPTLYSERLDTMKSDFLALCDKYDGKYLVMYTHPCRLFTTQFTDTFRSGNNPPRPEWTPAPLRPSKEIAELQRDFDAFLGWVVQRQDVTLTTYREIYATHRPSVVPWLDRDVLLQLASHTDACDYQHTNGFYLSPAEQFGLFVRAISILGESAQLPNAIAVRRLLGPVTSPPSNGPSGSVSLPDFLDAVRRVDTFCTETGRIPDNIRLGSEVVGPSSFMQALAALITAWHGVRPLPQSVGLHAAPAYPAITQRDDFQNLKFQGGWSIFPPGFEGNNVLEMIRLQAWTAKPATR